MVCPGNATVQGRQRGPVSLCEGQQMGIRGLGRALAPGWPKFGRLIIREKTVFPFQRLQHPCEDFSGLIRCHLTSGALYRNAHKSQLRYC